MRSSSQPGNGLEASNNEKSSDAPKDKQIPLISRGDMDKFARRFSRRWVRVADSQRFIPARTSSSSKGTSRRIGPSPSGAFGRSSLKTSSTAARQSGNFTLERRRDSAVLICGRTSVPHWPYRCGGILRSHRNVRATHWDPLRSAQALIRNDHTISHV